MNVFKGKTVLVSGHTGFKGSWLITWLTHLGANVVGMSNNIATEPSNYNVSGLANYISDNRLDIVDLKEVKKLMLSVQPDFVFHLAAQALVRESYDSPIDTMTVNAIGTANVLESLRSLSKPVVAIMITSDKAYDNVEWSWGYREIDKLGGKDPYSASKGMAELAIYSFVESYFKSSDSNVRVGITRAGNVIGGGDWAKDRIVPDCVRSWAENKVVEIRQPDATRPWQHVLEPLSGYLTLANELYLNDTYNGEAYNFGPPANQNYSVRDLIDEMSKYWTSVDWKDISNEVAHLHEAGLLKLNCDKALHDLNWQPTLDFNETVKLTANWYRTYYESTESIMYDFTISQINHYMELSSSRGTTWMKE